MKKLLMIAGMLVATPVAANAAAYGMAGCGLGSIVFADDPGIVQIFAATTNGTFANQTFGITTGTSNCAGGAAIAQAEDQKAFVQVNYANLARDAAQGQGEYLSTFAHLLGCSADAQPAFFQMTQSKHSELFSDEADPQVTLQSVHQAVSQSPELQASCSRAGA